VLRTILLTAALAFCLAAAEKKVITPAGGPPPVGPYSPGILAGDYLYVSGQGAAKADGAFPAAPREQAAQCLANVRRIVEAAGLTMEHVVSAQVYLKDIGAYDEMDRSWREAFPKNPPARAVLGVHRMPTDTPVEITVVAVRDLAQKRVVNPGGSFSPGVLTADRLYLSGFAGKPSDEPAAQVQQAFDGMAAVLKEAGMDFRHMVFVNPYLTDKMPAEAMNRVYAKQFEFGNTPARATIKVASLPGGASIEFTGVAVRDLAKRQAVRPKNMPPSPTASPCVWAGDTMFCSAKSGFIPGPNSGIYASTVETQVRQTMRNLLDGLEEGGIGLANVVATNVWLDNIDDFARMNQVYGSFFGDAPPTRTTLQQIPAGERKADPRDRWPTLEQISLIAVK
jgi:reactive intermediate/imine deaminase